MPAFERFSALIGEIYDASLDPALWPSVCESACAFIGASAAGLIWQDTLRKAAHVHFAWGIDPNYTQIYSETYCKLNPAFPTMLFFDVEEVWSIVPDCISREEFCRSRFGKEWLFPQGLVDGLFSNVEKSPTSCDTFLAVRTHERRFRGRRDAPAIRARRPACSPRRSDRSGDRSKDRRGGGARRQFRHACRRHVPGRCDRTHPPCQCQRPRDGRGSQRPACGERQARGNSTRRPTRHCSTVSSRPQAATRRSGGRASPYRSRRATASATLRMSCR